MFDAHCHIRIAGSLYCENELMLDKRFIDQNPIENQIEIVKATLYQLKNNNQTAVLHCVRETEQMIKILQEVQMPKGHVLWHGFNGSKETAKILNNLGVIISIGPHFNKDFKEIVTSNPLFTLETDYTGSSIEEHDQILLKHYEKCANILGISINELEKRCIDNAVAFTN